MRKILMEHSSSSSSSEPFIVPVAEAALDPAVFTAIARAQSLGALTSTVLPRIWAHRPEIASAQIALHAQFNDDAILPARLLELVRLRIASVNACEVCQTSRKSDDVSERDIACLGGDESRFSAAEQAALNYAAVFAEDHLSVGRGNFEVLRLYFSEPEMVELAMFAALMVGSGRLAYALRAFEVR
jgi:alkylhydroperoxidase family enzyme